MNFSELVRKNLAFVLLLPLLVAALVLVISLFKQPLYKSSLSLLVVQKQTGEVDANIAAKSAEQMADILSRVVDSESFRSAVLASGVKVTLPEEPWKEAKQWRKIVKTRNITDTGILVVDVYQPTSAVATKLATAVKNVLISDARDYLGVDSDSVVIRELNPPAPTQKGAATPNLLLNSIIGYLFGLITVLSLILLFPRKNWDAFIPIAKNTYVPHKTEAYQGGMIYPATHSLEPVNSDSGLIHQNRGFSGSLVGRANHYL